MVRHARREVTRLRIVSLLPSATETVCLLGLREALVGVSHDCDWPPGIQKEKPILSATIVPEEGSSRAIDAAVRAQAHRGRSVYHLDAERLHALQPDLILTQELCPVCAPSFSDVCRAARLLDETPRIVSLEPRTLEDIFENVRLVGDLTETRDRAEQVVAEGRRRLAEIAERLAGVRRRPRVLAIEWLDPLFVAGHWVPEMIASAGGVAPNRPGSRSVPISWERIEAFDPDAVVLVPCGFTPARTLAELSVLLEQPRWNNLRAVRSGRVGIFHGSHYFSRPSPRVVDGVELLARWLHPERFPEPLEGRLPPPIGWEAALRQRNIHPSNEQPIAHGAEHA